MNKKKVFIICFLIIIIALIVFLSKDFIIRKMFISKLENVTYDEYIVSFVSNDINMGTYYYKRNDKYMTRNYNSNNELYNFIEVTDIKNKKSYTYYCDTKEIDNEKVCEIIEPSLGWNENVLDMLKNENQQEKLSFRYLGTENKDNINCYKMIFEDGTGWSCTVYVDKINCVVIKLDFDMSKIMKEDELKNSEEMGQTINGHIIWKYDWDFELKQKDLFEMYK
ncbi:MAG: hypothetical protein OSJ66_05065 [Clostridia bacterium]|nr:hypothetical protein [Clostridia bacterium]